ncbi:hypothetical protein VKT23_006281 [Stygiomarasmius scandens]|uniref:polynucleotide adenylyltransferase n=1 Tax=Marasmiellus scandens TaxID=2682957 RepID=A0ABR1JPE2_9AGAR
MRLYVPSLLSLHRNAPLSVAENFCRSGRRWESGVVVNDGSLSRSEPHRPNTFDWLKDIKKRDFETDKQKLHYEIQALYEWNKQAVSAQREFMTMVQSVFKSGQDFPTILGPSIVTPAVHTIIVPERQFKDRNSALTHAFATLTNARLQSANSRKLIVSGSVWPTLNGIRWYIHFYQANAYSESMEYYRDTATRCLEACSSPVVDPLATVLLHFLHKKRVDWHLGVGDHMLQSMLVHFVQRNPAGRPLDYFTSPDKSESLGQLLIDFLVYYGVVFQKQPLALPPTEQDKNSWIAWSKAWTDPEKHLHTAIPYFPKLQKTFRAAYIQLIQTTKEDESMLGSFVSVRRSSFAYRFHAELKKKEQKAAGALENQEDALLREAGADAVQVVMSPEEIGYTHMGKNRPRGSPWSPEEIEAAQAAIEDSFEYLSISNDLTPIHQRSEDVSHSVTSSSKAREVIQRISQALSLDEEAPPTPALSPSSHDTSKQEDAGEGRWQVVDDSLQAASQRMVHEPQSEDLAERYAESRIRKVDEVTGSSSSITTALPYLDKRKKYVKPWLVDWYSNREYKHMDQKLHWEISAYFHYVRPASKEIFAYRAAYLEIQKRLRDAGRELGLAKDKGMKNRSIVFGSAATRALLPQGDIDITYDFGPSFLRQKSRNMFKTISALVSSGLVSRPFEVISKARVPVVNCKTTPAWGSIPIDITFNQADEVNKSVKVIKGYLSSMPAARPLLMVLKQFLLLRGLNKPFTGGLGSYPLLCMVLSFLQVNPFRRPKNFIENPWGSMSFGILLRDFLWYYGKKFDYEKTYIDVSSSSVMPKSSASPRDFPGLFYVPVETKGGKKLGRKQRVETQRKVSIKCMINPENDAGRSTYAIRKIQRAFIEAYEALENVSSLKVTEQEPESLLEVMVLFDEEVVKYRAKLERLVDNGAFGTFTKDEEALLRPEPTLKRKDRVGWGLKPEEGEEGEEDELVTIDVVEDDAKSDANILKDEVFLQEEDIVEDEGVKEGEEENLEGVYEVDGKNEGKAKRIPLEQLLPPSKRHGDAL